MRDGRFLSIEPISRGFWGGAFQQLFIRIRRGVWRSRYVDLRDHADLFVISYSFPVYSYFDLFSIQEPSILVLLFFETTTLSVRFPSLFFFRLRLLREIECSTKCQYSLTHFTLQPLPSPKAFDYPIFLPSHYPQWHQLTSTQPASQSDPDHLCPLVRQDPNATPPDPVVSLPHSKSRGVRFFCWRAYTHLVAFECSYQPIQPSATKKCAHRSRLRLRRCEGTVLSDSDSYSGALREITLTK